MQAISNPSIQPHLERRAAATYLLAGLLDLLEERLVVNRALDKDLLLLEADIVIRDACKMARPSAIVP